MSKSKTTKVKRLTSVWVESESGPETCVFIGHATVQFEAFKLTGEKVILQVPKGTKVEIKEV
jgi:hypothetical protein